VSSPTANADLPPGIAGPGTVLAGKIRVEGVLGVGGMGVVLAGHHLHLAKRVAVKLLLPTFACNPEIVARFLREARAASKIRSDHIARVLDVATLDDGAPYIVMELLEGEDVARLLERSPRLEVAQAVDYVLEACVALAEAHAEGVVHRDLKPSNLFVSKDGVKVLDFGISKILDDGESEGERLSITKTSSVLGSPLYMSPEQLRASRDVDARTDIWSLGIIFFEALTGVRPFDGNSIAEIGVGVFTKEPPPLHELRPDVPPDLAATIATCLEKERDARFASVAELAFEAAPFGTQRAARALERVASFASRLPPPTRAARVRTPLGAGSTRPPPRGASTTDGLSATTAPPRRDPPRVWAIVGVVATGCLVLATAGAVVLWLGDAGPRGDAASGRASSPGHDSTSTSASASAPAASGATTTLPLDEPGPSASPSSRRGGTRPHGPSARASASGSASSPAPPPSSSGSPHSDRFE
jgi:serine/threonine-protein kinase